jgi:hypothetical protein
MVAALAIVAWSWPSSPRAAPSPAGNVVVLHGDRGHITIPPPGAPSGRVTVRAATGGRASVASVTIRRSHVRVNGLDIGGTDGNCVTIASGLSDVTVSHNRIHDCGNDGIHFERPEGTGRPYTHHVRILRNTVSGVGHDNDEGNNLTIYADRLLVQGNNLSDSPNDAIDFWGDRHVYRRNLIHDLSNSHGNHNDAFQTWTDYDDGFEGKPVTNLLIDRNIVRNVTGGNSHCAMTEGPGHSTWRIRNNLFWNIDSICLILDTNEGGTHPSHPGIHGVLVYNNTFVNAGSGSTVEFNSETTGRFVNNLLYNTADNHYENAQNVVRGYNFYGGSTPAAREPHSLRGNPRFVDPAGNFRLAAGSRAIDRGDHGKLIHPSRRVDLAGHPRRRSVDIGAYERQGPRRRPRG